MLHVGDNLNFSTVFQFVVVFEGFAIWKGARFFNVVVAPIDIALSVSDDEEDWEKKCEDLKKSQHRGKDIGSIIWMWLSRKFAACYRKCLLLLSYWWWMLIHGVHNALVGFIRFSPCVTIPGLAFLYMFQIGCNDTTFSWGRLVWYYFLAKFCCYIFLNRLASILVKHFQVEVSASDNVNILPE